MATGKRANREKLIGYILMAALIIGLIFLVYWMVAMDEGDSRFQNIERLRGELRIPESVQTFSIGLQIIFLTACPS